MTRYDEGASPQLDPGGSGETRGDDRHLHADRTPVPEPASIPDELRHLKQWVVWRKAKLRNDKPPLNARTLGNASSTNPDTWASFTEAVAAVAAGRADGVGFVFTEDDPYAFIDLDDVVDSDGAVDPWAKEQVDRFATYTERSMSGHGLHLVLRGRKPGDRSKSSRVEIYDRARYCAMTGARWPGTPATIEPRQEELSQLYIEEFGDRAVIDEALVGTVAAGLILNPAANPPEGKLHALLANPLALRTWKGQRPTFPSPSEYDLALANFAVDADWSDQEIANLLIAFRREQGEAEDLKKVVTHLSYLSRTIARARKRGVSERGCRITDTGCGQRLVLRHGRELRYCPTWKTWLHWDGTRWKRDEVGHAVELAKETVQSMRLQMPQVDNPAKLEKAIRRYEQASAVEAMLKMARTVPGVPVLPAQLDADPWKLNVANGTVDLITGELLPHDREDLITRYIPVKYVPGARSEIFDKFIERVLPDSKVRAFVQRSLGSALHGANQDEIVIFLYGLSGAGKSTLMTAVRAATGDYCVTADLGTFLGRAATGGSGATPQLARLVGRRIVISSEVGFGAKLNESLVNQLTGGDAVTARGLYQSAFEYVPTFTPILISTTYPEISDPKGGLRRRVKVVPFMQAIPLDEQDTSLKDRMREPRQTTAVLTWLIEGCIAWQRDGLNTPSEVQMATQEYMNAMDFIGQFLGDCVRFSSGSSETNAYMWQAYVDWCKRSSAPQAGRKQFTRELLRRGFQQTRSGAGRKWANTVISVVDRFGLPKIQMKGSRKES